MGKDSDAYTLEASIAPVLSVIPAAPVDLDQHVQATSRARILARQGFFGEPDADALGLAGLTYAPAAGEALGIVLTDQGVYVRQVRFKATDSSRQNVDLGVVPDKDLKKILESRRIVDDGSGYNAFFVTAEADVSLSRLYDALEVLQGRGVAVLAAPVNFDVETAPLPCLKREAVNHVWVLKGQDAIANELGICSRRTKCNGDNGRIVVHAATDASGRVTEACLLEKQINHPLLERCALEAVVRGSLADRAEPDRQTLAFVVMLSNESQRFSATCGG